MAPPGPARAEQGPPPPPRGAPPPTPRSSSSLLSLSRIGWPASPAAAGARQQAAPPSRAPAAGSARPRGSPALPSRALASCEAGSSGAARRRRSARPPGSPCGRAGAGGSGRYVVKTGPCWLGAPGCMLPVAAAGAARCCSASASSRAASKAPCKNPSPSVQPKRPRISGCAAARSEALRALGDTAACVDRPGMRRRTGTSTGHYRCQGQPTKRRRAWWQRVRDGPQLPVMIGSTAPAGGCGGAAHLRRQRQAHGPARLGDERRRARGEPLEAAPAVVVHAVRAGQGARGVAGAWRAGSRPVGAAS